jgi:hypothetical protein
MTIEKTSAGMAGQSAPDPHLARLAAALGWDHVPVLTQEQIREADRRMAAAQAEARRIYGNPEGSA